MPPQDPELLRSDGEYTIGVCDDSRKVKEGSLFVAVKGHGTDGHAYIGKAIEAGATAIVYEDDCQPDSRQRRW